MVWCRSRKRLYEIITQLPTILAFSVGAISLVYNSSVAYASVKEYFPQADQFLDGSYSSATVLLMDTSGSMDEMDVSGLRKIEAAIEAASNVVDIIQAENELLSSHSSLLGIVDFNTTVAVDFDLSDHVSNAGSILRGLTPNGGTGMPDGLRAALDLLRSAPANAKPMIILLSDGMANVGLGGNENLSPEDVRKQVFDLAEEAARSGVCIYTVGLGVPGATGDVSGEASIDIDLLQRLPQIAGCGQFYLAQEASLLANIYLKLRHTSVGNILVEREGSIHQDEEIIIDNVPVPANQELLLYTVNWKGSRVKIKLQDPSGNLIDDTTPSVKEVSNPRMTALVIQNPLPGTWQASLYGLEIPSGSTNYLALISVRPISLFVPHVSPTPFVTGSTGFTGEGEVVLVILLVLFFAVLGWLFYKSSHARSSGDIGVVTGSARLIGVSGCYIGQLIPLYSPVMIGRGSECSIYLPYPNVSRQHCLIFYTHGVWVIRDTGSKFGTFVNGVRIEQVILHPGNMIRIGEEVFRFES